jgi:long-chain acyl-CoA synthetase
VNPISASFAALEARAPDAPLCLTPRAVVTRRQLGELAAAMERELERLGAPPGAVVALSARNGPAFLAGLLALARSGRVALLLDAASPAKEQRAIAAGLRAVAVLSADRDSPLESERWHAAALEASPRRELRGAAASKPNSINVMKLTSGSIIKLTSGSTGAPRGIAASARSLVADASALGCVMGLAPDDRLLASVPMSFSYGLSSLAIPALTSGSALVLPDAAHPLGALAAARSCRATFFPAVPVLLQALLKRDAARRLPPSLRLVVSAGAPLPEVAARRFRERFGLHVHAFYGASECGGIAYDRGGGAAERGTVGAPIPGVEVSIEDDRVVVRSPTDTSPRPTVASTLR